MSFIFFPVDAKILNTRSASPVAMYRKSNFDETDMVRVFLSITHAISRQELGETLNIGEGSMRSILSALKGKGLLASSRRGHTLTEKGNKLRERLAALTEGPKPIVFSGYLPKEKKAALLLKSPSQEPISYIHRDLAVMRGCSAAVILEFKKDSLVIPQAESAFSTEQLTDIFRYAENDRLIMTCAKEQDIADRGALVIARSLSREFDRILGSMLK
jgi:hypothetical protein